MDINSILGSLTGEDIENLQDIASSLLKNAEEKKGERSGEASDIGDIFSELDINAFSNIASVMSKLHTNDDPGRRLIMSLKPLLSPERQKRADEAIRILRIIDLVPVLRDSGLLKGVL